MVFRLFRQGNQNPNILIAEVREDLKAARHNLANKRYVEASALFKDIENKLMRHIGKAEPTDKLSNLLGEARLGIWASEYLQGLRTVDDHLKGAKSFTSDGYWLRFVVNTLTLKEDTSPSAVSVYLRYLNHKKDTSLPTGFLKFLEVLTGRTSTIIAESRERIIIRLTELAVPEVWIYQRIVALSLHRHDLTAAETHLNQASKLFPNNHYFEQMLGYIAEENGNLSEALLKYQKCEDWLRFGVVSYKIDDYEQAAQALDRVLPEQRKSVWFYYRGLVFFKTSQYELCLKCWEYLAEQNPQDQDLKGQIAVTKGHLVISLFSKSIKQLVLEKQPTAAKPLLQRVAGIYPDQTISMSWLGVCTAAERTEDVDKKLYENLRESIGTGALFLVLRGVWLLPSNPVLGFRYFERAYKELPSFQNWQIIAVAGALIAYLSALKSNQHTVLDLKWVLSACAESSNSDVLKTVLGVITVLRLKTHYIGFEVNIAVPPVHMILQTLKYAVQGEMEQAFASLQNQLEGWGTSIVPTLRWAIVEQLHARAVQQRRWNDVSRWITTGLELRPAHEEVKRQQSLLADFEVQNLLAARNWNGLTHHYLSQLRQNPETTQHHFNLALCYTAQAQDADERNTPDFLLWDKAIGHWAVVLADNSFWSQWKANHQLAYGGEIADESLERLRSEIIPNRYRAYHEGWANSSSASKQYAYYAALLPVEIDAAKAIQNALKEKEAIPEEIRMFPSPTLLKSWEYSQIAWSFAGSALTGDAHKLVRNMLSPLGQVHTLVSAGQIGEALELLRERVTIGNDKEAQTFFVTLVEQRNEQLLDAERFEEVRKLANEALKWSKNTTLRNQLALATARWSRELLNERRFEETVAELRHVATMIIGNSELKSTLAEALIQWGHHLISEGYTQTGLALVQEGLDADHNNQAVKQSAAMMYHDLAVDDFNRSVEDLHSVNLSRALDYVNKAVALDPSDHNKEFLSRIHLKLALQAVDKDKWAEAAQHTQEAFNLDPTTETGRLWVMIERDWSLALYRRNRLKDAIEIAEKGFERALKLAEISKDNSILDNLDFAEIISVMYNDLGAVYGRAGVASSARQCFEMALKYDSSNHTARQNLRIVRGY